MLATIQFDDDKKSKFDAVIFSFSSAFVILQQALAIRRKKSRYFVANRAEEPIIHHQVTSSSCIAYVPRSNSKWSNRYRHCFEFDGSNPRRGSIDRLWSRHKLPETLLRLFAASPFS
jgi:hypothetical protein